MRSYNDSEPGSSVQGQVQVVVSVSSSSGGVLSPISRSLRRSAAAAAPRGFTIVELIVVVAIVALVLGIGLPAFNAMSASSRMAKARQLVTGTLARANAIALSDRTHTAVRFMPSAWELDDSVNAATSASNRNTQSLATYRYVTSAQGNPSNVGEVMFAERFERIKDGPAAVLPTDVWAAPAEALDTGATAILRNGNSAGLLRDLVLSGRIGAFDLNADSLFELDPTVNNPSFATRNENFLDADDFLVVFDPDTGLVGSHRRVPWRLLGYDPRTTGSTAQRETAGEPFSNSNRNLRNPYQRFCYTGVVLYPREPFVALGLDAPVPSRFDLLSRTGQRFYVSRTGGALLEGN